MPGLTRACYGEIVSVGSPECVRVCVYVRERERVCVCVRERERSDDDGKRGAANAGVRWAKLLQSLRARPPSRH